MTYYLDGDFRVHVQQNEAGTLTPWVDSTGFFGGKCDAFIEGYRVVPMGATWVRPDGCEFRGEMITPAVNPIGLLAAQVDSDKAVIADLDADVVELTYQNVLLELGVE